MRVLNGNRWRSKWRPPNGKKKKKKRKAAGACAAPAANCADPTPASRRPPPPIRVSDFLATVLRKSVANVARRFRFDRSLSLSLSAGCRRRHRHGGSKKSSTLSQEDSIRTNPEGKAPDAPWSGQPEGFLHFFFNAQLIRLSNCTDRRTQ